MDFRIGDAVPGRKRKEEGAQLSFEGNALIINCMRCKYVPEPGSTECMSCMVDSMSKMGCSDRIILRTGKDTEISGKSGWTIGKIAQLKKWSVPLTEDKKCHGCDRSRTAVMNKAWATFPDVGFDEAYRTVRADAKNPACRRCQSSTETALKQLETDLMDVKKEMLKA